MAALVAVVVGDDGGCGCGCPVGWNVEEAEGERGRAFGEWFLEEVDVRSLWRCVFWYVQKRKGGSGG